MQIKIHYAETLLLTYIYKNEFKYQERTIMGVILYAHTYNMYASNKMFYKPHFFRFLYLQVIVNQNISTKLRIYHGRFLLVKTT